MKQLKRIEEKVKDQTAEFLQGEFKQIEEILDSEVTAEELEDLVYSVDLAEVLAKRPPIVYCLLDSKQNKFIIKDLKKLDNVSFAQFCYVQNINYVRDVIKDYIFEKTGQKLVNRPVFTD